MIIFRLEPTQSLSPRSGIRYKLLSRQISHSCTTETTNVFLWGFFRLYSNSTILFKYCYFSVQFYCWMWYETFCPEHTDISPKYNSYYNLLVSAITVLWKRSFNQAAFVSVNTSLPLFFIIWESVYTELFWDAQSRNYWETNRLFQNNPHPRPFYI